MDRNWTSVTLIQGKTRVVCFHRKVGDFYFSCDVFSGILPALSGNDVVGEKKEGDVNISN